MKMKKMLLTALCIFAAAGWQTMETPGAGNGPAADSTMPAYETARFGVMTGSTGEFYLENAYPDASLERFDNIADGVLALQSGKTDYVLTSYTTALNFVRANPDIYICEKNVIAETVAIAVGKDNRVLYEEVDGVLVRFLEDGTMEEILSHWMKEDGSPYDEVTLPEAETGTDVDWLDVGIAANREPMCFVQDNEYAGVDCELIERIAFALGRKVRYSDMQFSSLVAALDSGKVDVVISNMTNTPERAEKVDFTRDYFENPQVYLAKVRDGAAGAGSSETAGAGGNGGSSSPSLEFTDPAQLAGRKVGIETGTIFDQVLKEQAPEAVPEYYNSVVDQLEALTGGKIDGIVTDEPVARVVIGETRGIGCIPELMMEDSYGYILRKEDRELAAEFDALLREFREDGTLAEADARWFGEDESAKVLPETYGTPDRGTLVMAVMSSKPPFTYMKDGELVGYEIDLMMRMCDRLGYGLELQDVRFEAMIPGVMSGRYDVGAACISITPERAQSVQFTEPSYTGGVVMIVRTAKEEAAATGWVENLKQSVEKTFIREDRWKLIAGGLAVTCLIAVMSAVAGSILGFGVCMMRMAKRKPVVLLAKMFVRLVQGTPVLVILMILYYVVFTGKASLDAVTVAVIGFSINFGAYVSEMLRTGIEAVDKGQQEAAQAMGYSRAQTFAKVTFPQAARHFLPVYQGEFISMVKMTSVVGYIAIQDLTKASDIIRSRTYEAFFPLIATAVLYFLLAWVLTRVLGQVEKSIDPKRRRHRLPE